VRLISRKIWRAFPELDAFDDETCERYINRSWHLLESFRGWLLAGGVVTVSDLQKVDRRELLRLRGIGPRAVFDIERFLERRVRGDGGAKKMRAG